MLTVAISSLFILITKNVYEIRNSINKFFQSEKFKNSSVSGNRREGKKNGMKTNILVIETRVECNQRSTSSIINNA